MSVLKTLSTFIGAITISLASVVYAGPDTETDANDVILAGHDAVAYSRVGKPVLGSPDYTVVYGGAIYRFSSARNRNSFRDDPARYAPQFGGFCAYGMTFGKKFEIDGKAFQIVDGKLYVNKNLKVYETWKEDIPKNINIYSNTFYTQKEKNGNEFISQGNNPGNNRVVVFRSQCAELNLLIFNTLPHSRLE